MCANPEGASDLFPLELWKDILNRLPVRSLLTLKRVSSKFFFALIETPDFSTLHFSCYNNLYSKPEGSDLLLLDRHCCSSQLELYHGNAFKKTLEFKIPLEKKNDNIEVGQVDGLVWIHGMKFNIPCNPSMRKSLLILPSSNPYFVFWSSTGFGFDPLTNDYEAVTLIKPIYSILDFPRVTLVNIYSLRKGSWSSFQTDSVTFEYCSERNAYANGCLHWMMEDDSKSKPQVLGFSYVLSFDVGTKVFSHRELPQSSEWKSGLVMSFRELLALLIVSGSHFSVWVERENNGWNEELGVESGEEFYDVVEKTCMWDAIQYSVRKVVSW